MWRQGNSYSMKDKDDKSWVYYSSIGMEMAVMVALMVIVGVKVDKRAQFRFPVFTVLGVALGVIMAFLYLFKKTKWLWLRLAVADLLLLVLLVYGVYSGEAAHNAFFIWAWYWYWFGSFGEFQHKFFSVFSQ